MHIGHTRNVKAALSATPVNVQDSDVGSHAALNSESTMKTAVIVISDPQAGEEALGRVFNALAVAAEGKRADDEVEISFIGTGTRWPAELAKLTHPAHDLYDSVRELVAGASCACAAVFGASDGLNACGIEEKKDNALSGGPGLLSLRRYQTEGWHILIF